MAFLTFSLPALSPLSLLKLRKSRRPNFHGPFEAVLTEVTTQRCRNVACVAGGCNHQMT